MISESEDDIAFGDANDEDLRRKRETLRNFSEYVPLGLILLAAFEHNFGQSVAVALYGGVFLVSRILHIIGSLYVSTPALRAVAMIMQHIAFLVVGGLLVYKAVLS